MSFGEAHPECAIVALLGAGGTATLVRDLWIPRGEDADVWRELTGDRLIGVMTISDLTGDRTEVITDERFASKSIRTLSGRATRPRSIPPSVSISSSIWTPVVLRVECLGEA